MRMVVLADLHLGLSQSNVIWHTVSIDLAKEIHDYAIKHNIDTIAVLGDLFDNRKFIGQRTHDVAMNIVTNIWKDFNVILILGNHDQYYKEQPTPNWLNMFKDSNNVTIVDIKPHIVDDCCFIPWDYDITKIQKCNYLFGHLEINSFYMNNYYACNTSHLNTNNFDKFKAVYSGHFHFPQTYNNITYIGSPFQQTFGDVGSNRGYYIFDDGKIEFIKFTSAPEFVIIRANEKFIPDRIRGNIVKLVFDRDYGNRKNNEITERMEMLEPVSWTIDTTNFSIDAVAVETQPNEIIIKDNTTLLKEFISNLSLPEHLGKKTLLKMVNMLMNEMEIDNK